MEHDPPVEPDEQLLESCRLGDPSAFDRLVERHRDRVAALAWRLTGWQAAEVEEIVQETFITLWRDLERGRRRGALGPWLAGVVVHRCRHRRRSFARRRRHEQAAARGADRATPPEPRDARAEQLRRAIRRLPARWREAIVLKHLEELPVAAIAEIVRSSPAAVEQRLVRGRRRLAELMEGAPPDDA